MAVTHISETDFAGNYAAVLDRARAGEAIVIDGATPLRLARESSIADSVRVLHTQPRLISDILADLTQRGSTSMLPAGFANAVEEGIHAHRHETLADPWV